MRENAWTHVFTSILCLMMLTASAYAQSPQPDSARAHWSYAAWGGLAQNSPADIWGAEQGRDIAVGAVRLTRWDDRMKRVAWDYHIDFVPLAWLSLPRSERLPPCSAGIPGLCLLDPPVNTSAYGFGVAPMGVQLRHRLHRVVQPFVATNAGILWFTRPVPSERAAHLNFTANAGGGLLLGAPGRMGLMVGYKFYHVSNGGTAQSNPGVDGHMIYVGLLRTPR